MKKTNCFTKALAVFLTALMLLSVAPLAAMSDVLPKLDLNFDFAVTAHAEGSTPYLTSGYCGDTSDGKDGKDIAWSLDADGTLTLTGTGKMGSTPNRADNRVKKVVVGEGITEVADYAFSGCEYIAEVILAPSIDRIGNYAFYRNFALTSVDLSNVSEIGEYAFSLSKITTVSLANCSRMGSHAFEDCRSLENCTFSNSIDEIPEYAFYSAKLQTLDLPESILTIGKYAFSGNQASEIVFHEGLKAISERAFYGVSVVELAFPDSLESIGTYAFGYCDSLTTICFGVNLREVSMFAFDNCCNLTGTIAFPNACESVAFDAFDHTSVTSFVLGDKVRFAEQSDIETLLSITVSEDNPYHSSFDGVLYKKGFTQIVQCPSKDRINIPKEFPLQANTTADFLEANPYLKYVNIDEDNEAYKSIDGIVYSKDGKEVMCCPFAYEGPVNIADGAEIVNGYAFRMRKNITGVNFPDSLTEIGDRAFDSCVGITSLVIPGSLRTMGSGAFGNCRGVTDLYVDEGVTYISGSAFEYCSGLQRVVLPDSLKSLYGGAFANCASLSSIDFGDGLEKINDTVFYWCRSLPCVILGKNVQEIGSLAFYECEALESVVLNEKIERIKNHAFYGCSALSGEITIPDSCLSVGREAFSGTKITKLCLGKNVAEYGTSSNMDSLVQIDVSPDNLTFSSYDGVLYTKDYSRLLQCPAKNQINLPVQFSEQEGNFLTPYPFLSQINVDENNLCYHSENGILYTKDKKTLVICPASYDFEEVNVLSGVETIGANAFIHCKTIQTVNLPQSLKTIGEKAFNDCINLTEITVPDGVTGFEISTSGWYAAGCFEGCKRLNTVILGNGLTLLSDRTFAKCSNLRTVVLGERIAHINGDPFYETGLINLSLSKALQKYTFNSHTILTFSSLVVPNKYTFFENIEYLRTPTNTNTIGPFGGMYPKTGTITGYCGSPAHELAIKRLYNWNSLGHTWLNWYVAEPANFDHDGLEKRDCAYCGESETRVIPKLERDIYTATFVADGKVVASVDFQKGTTVIDEPAVPARDRYTGKWEDYTLNDADLTINAVYSLIKSDDAQEIETDSTIEHYTEKDDVLFRVKATSAAKIVKSVVSQSIPLDIVLVVDQSGSMEDTLGGATKKVDALKDAANSFIASVAENARLTGANHRIAIAGFGLAGTYSGYQPYENTELLTGANGTVNYLNVTSADYASALLPVLNGTETNAALTSAVAAIEARGATAADLGLEMAKGIFANTDSTGRERVVIFMTDGEPTYQSSFQKEVANNAVYNAGLIKNAYDALIYSVGIFDQSQSANRKIQSFMNAVSSNYPNAKTYTALGAAASDLFSITAEHTDALNDVFHTITTESLSHTAPFDNVTLIKTLSPYVTLTEPQEETLRVNVMRQYGISNDQITITRDDQGRTEIRIDGLTPYEVTDENGNISYEVAIEFFASLNEHASAAGDYTVDTEDSGIMLGDDALGYEVTFGTNSLNLSAQKTRYIFTINGEIYEIAEGSTVAAAVPETDFAADWQFSGWNTTGVSNANGTIIDATLVKAPRTVTWHTADGDTTQVYTEGQFLNPPEVPDRADGSKFLSWDKSLPTVMLDQDLEFTAVYGPHIHRYVSELTKKATCTEDGILTYTCICGDSYTETVGASGHNYEAITATGDSDPTRCTFVCTNCGDRYDYALNYKVEERTGWGSRTVYEFALTDDDLNTGMQPDGSIDVRIPLNEFQGTATRVKVQRYVNGRWEAVPAVIEDGFLVITADHFTPYEVQFTFSCNETGEHTWNQGKETKAATCTEEGEMTYTCETCESIKTEPIGKKDHTPGVWIVDKAATCKEAGSKHRECTVCHNTIATETIAADKANHASYGTTLKNKVDANCTTKGYTGDTVCNGCGTVIKKGSETTALGHTAPNSKGNCDRCGTHLKDVDPGSSTPAGACKYCGQVHTGPFGWLIKFFHSILALFGLRK